MKKSFLIILSVFFAFGITSCDLQKIRHQKCQKWGVCQSKDSIVIKDSIAHDSIILDNSELWLSMLFECDSAGHVLVRQIDSLTTKNIDLQTALKNNRVVIHATVPEKVIRIPKLMHSVTKKTTVTVKVNELKWHQSARLWAFNVIMILLLLWLINNAIKLYIYKKLPV